MASKTKTTQKSTTSNIVDFDEKVRKGKLNLQEEDLHKMRLRFAYLLVVLVAISNIVTLAILFFAGFAYKGFTLSDTVIVAVISATVAELASLFIIILKYLFPSPKEKSDS